MMFLFVPSDSNLCRGFLDNGKHSLQTRGLIVLLMSKAAGPGAQECDPHEMVSGIYPRFVSYYKSTEIYLRGIP